MIDSQEYDPIITASDIDAQPVTWYVENLLPRTGLVLLVGGAGQGKTSAASSVLSAISAGLTPLSQLSRATESRDVLILSREETLPSIKDRTQRLHGDLSRIHISDKHDLRDVNRLKREIQAGTVAIMIDSLTAFTEGNLNSRREMFGALDGLRRVAEPKPERNYPGALILLIHHTNSRSGSISDRIAGSKAIVGVVRHALHVGVHPYDDTRRVISVCKSNIGPMDVNRTFALSPFTWGEQLDATAAELLGGTDDTPNRAAKWLMAHMVPGEHYLASELFKQASDSRGLSRRSLQRAARYLKLDTERIGFAGKVYWTYGADDTPSSVRDHPTLFVMPKRHSESEPVQ